MKKSFLSTKNNKNVTPWFIFFCSISIIYISFVINLWYLFFLVILLFNIRSIKNFIFFIFLLLIFMSYIMTINKMQFRDTLSNLLVFKLNNIVKQNIFLFLEEKYSNELVAFIKLILFNIKTKDTYIISKQSIDLGITWLFQSSGYHLHILINIIMLICNKKKKIGLIISLIISFGYLILLKTSYAILKILLHLLLNKLFDKFHITNLNKIGIIGLIICTINPLCFADYGFILSIIISIVSLWIKSLNLNNKIIRQLIFNFAIQVTSIPIIMNITTKISLLSIISSFIFYYIISFIFLYFIIFSWFPFMTIIHKLIIYLFCTLIGNISFNDLFIKSFVWQHTWLLAYYGLIFLLSKVISYVIRINSI